MQSFTKEPNYGYVNGSAVYIIEYNGYRFVGEATCHPDDLDFESERVGLTIAEARAKEIELVYGAIKDAKPDDKLVAIKSLEALEKVADGQANKVFIPFDATKTLASVSALFEAK